MPEWRAVGAERQEFLAGYAELGVSRVIGLLQASAESDEALDALHAFDRPCLHDERSPQRFGAQLVAAAHIRRPALAHLDTADSVVAVAEERR